jgi:hypothetical protein
MSGDHQTPPGRPTKDDAASIAYLFLAAVLLGTGEEDFDFFLKCRTSEKAVIGISNESIQDFK